MSFTKTLLILAAMAIANASSTVASPVTYRFDIDGQTLSKALRQYSQISRQEIMFTEEVVKSVKTVSLKGEYTAEAALARLLDGTGLVVRRSTSGAITIVKAEEVSSAVGPGDQMRVANTISPSETSRKESPAEEPENQRNQVTVEGQRDRPKPFGDANVDIPRTINDVQPYYIFDAKTIDASGAVNIEDFLKQRLTMNTVSETNSQLATSSLGSTSSIDLRGVGTDKTLILVNGRRMPGVTIFTDAVLQPDLNGIPLSAIERIEVMPSSASGIYGGGALGGVVNVILKRNYSGGEGQLSYDNTLSGDSPRRSLSGSYGLSLGEGRTHFNISAAWTDKTPLLLKDRAQIFRRNLAEIQSRSPTFISTRINPWLGSLPNIVPNSSATQTLTLKNGSVPLNSRNTYVPAGTSDDTPASELRAGLLANAGQLNLEFPLSTQIPTGLLMPLGSTPENRSLQVGVRQQMRPWLELMADLSWNETRTESIYNPAYSFLAVPATAPTNPFTTDVRVKVPDASDAPLNTTSQNRSVTLGAIVQLPQGWIAALDYTWSENRFVSASYFVDTTARTADLRSGALNPFVDTLRYPLNFEKYMTPSFYQGTNTLHDVALRASGQLPSLPWGQPNLTVALERRLGRTPERTYEYRFPITLTSNYTTKFYARESVTDSGYLEAAVPLVVSGRWPLLYSMDLQFSGRTERYQVDTGTSSETIYYNQTPVLIEYTNNQSQPLFSRASYTSSNYTVGLKYQPARDITLRVSHSTAFLPPTPSQLISDLPRVAESYEQIIDPVTNDTLEGRYEIVGGGNPGLIPQNSRGLNMGIIWQPQWKPLAGLRLNAEYYRIEQFDAIGSLDPQQIVNQEDTYPDRVVRDTGGTITRVDASAVNLYHRETEGWDVSVDYAVSTSAGRFSVSAVESIIAHLRNQYAKSLPEYELVSFVNEGGAAKYKTNATFGWESGPFRLNWTTLYFGSYKQYGVAGGPSSVQTSNGEVSSSTYINAQGSDAIPSQVYHNLLIGYVFDLNRRSSAGNQHIDGLAVQIGVRNVFDKAPPLDAYRSGQYYLSPYGDTRLRSFWLSAKLDF